MLLSGCRESLLLGNGGGRKCIAREGIELNFGGPEEEKRRDFLFPSLQFLFWVSFLSFWVSESLSGEQCLRRKSF